MSVELGGDVRWEAVSAKSSGAAGEHEAGEFIRTTVSATTKGFVLCADLRGSLRTDCRLYWGAAPSAASSLSSPKQTKTISLFIMEFAPRTNEVSRPSECPL